MKNEKCKNCKLEEKQRSEEICNLCKNNGFLHSRERNAIYKNIIRVRKNRYVGVII